MQIENENADLRFLNTQYAHRVQTLELETEEKSERINRLSEKNFDAVVELPGGTKQQIPTRRQRMELKSTLLPQSEDTKGTPIKGGFARGGASAGNQHRSATAAGAISAANIDLLKAAEQRVSDYFYY